MAYTTIDNPELYFQCKLYTGNGSDDHAMTFDNTDTSMQPDMVWMKSRTQSGYNHYLVDVVRGVTKAIRPNLTNDEDTYSDAFKSFDSNGFTLDDDTSNSEINQNTKTYVAWCWKESATAGFDIVSYTGQGDGTASSALNVSHSLSAVPHWMWVKNRADSTQHNIYHHKNTSAPATEIIYLNLTNATSDDNGFWNDTAPTSSVFTVGGDNGTNGNSDAMIAYLWTEKKGYSKFGSFEGNNNADGSFVYLGFKPRWIMIKDIDSSNTVGGSAATSWGIWDSKRMPGNPASNPLWSNKDTRETIRGNASSANTGGSDGNGLGGFIHLDMLSNGFKCRTGAAELNDAQTYVYMAFAEAPFVNSNGVPCNAK